MGEAIFFRDTISYLLSDKKYTAYKTSSVYNFPGLIGKYFLRSESFYDITIIFLTGDRLSSKIITHMRGFKYKMPIGQSSTPSFIKNNILGVRFAVTIPK